MSGYEDVGVFLSNQIGQIIIIIASIFTAAKYVDRRNDQKVMAVRKEFLGEKLDGEGGILGGLKAEWTHDIRSINKNIETLSQRFDMVIDYIGKDINRIDKAVERVSSRAGVYHVSKEEDNYTRRDQNIKERRENDTEKGRERSGGVYHTNE